jgi:hypothetical protein
MGEWIWTYGLATTLRRHPAPPADRAPRDA